MSFENLEAFLGDSEYGSILRASSGELHTPSQLDKCLRRGSEDVSLTMRWALGLFFFLANLVSLIVNLGLWRALRQQRICTHLHFYRFIISFVCSAVGQCVLCFWVFFPVAVLQLDMPDWLNTFLTSPMMLFELGSLFVAVYISIDRFVLFNFPECYGSLTGRWQIVWLAVPWASAGIIFASILISGCFLRVNKYALEFTFECSNCWLHFNLLSWLHFAVCGFVALMYLIVFSSYLFKYIRRVDVNQALDSPSETANRGTGMEFKLAVQFFLVMLAQWTVSIVTFALPQTNSRAMWLNALNTSMTLFNTMTTPATMLLFQPKLRSAFVRVLREGLLFPTPKGDTIRRGNSISAAPNFDDVAVPLPANVSAGKTANVSTTTTTTTTTPSFSLPQ